jgi:DNA-binding protein Alba
MDYVAPALLRLNNIGELVIKATISLSIVTAVDVAEIVKRDLGSVVTSSIKLGTNAFVISSGETRRMSCIEIRFAPTRPSPEAPVMKDADIAVAKPTQIMLVKAEPMLEVPAAEVINTVTARSPESAPAIVRKKTARRSGKAPEAKKKIRKKRTSTKKKK